MKTVAQHWDEFAALVLSPNASVIQHAEMRIAFFGGFSAALAALVEVADQAQNSDDIGVTMIQRFHSECAQFAVDLAKVRA
jgi:hypothetical protein